MLNAVSMGAAAALAKQSLRYAPPPGVEIVPARCRAALLNDAGPSDLRSETSRTQPTRSRSNRRNHFVSAPRKDFGGRPVADRCTGQGAGIACGEGIPATDG